MKPAMSTLSPDSTRMRVEIFASRELGVAGGVGVAVGGAVAVGVALAAGVAVAAGVAMGVAAGVGVAVAPGVAVAVGPGVGVGEGCGVVATKTFASSRFIQPQLADQANPRSCPVARIIFGFPLASKLTHP